MEGEFTRFEGLKTDGRLDDHLHDRIRVGLDDLFDLHAAAARADDADTLGLAVEHIAQIELALERRGKLDVNPVDWLAFGACLEGDQALAEEVVGCVPNVFVARANSDAACLAARARMDLRLHRPARAPELDRRIRRFLGCAHHGSRRHRNAELGQ